MNALVQPTPFTTTEFTLGITKDDDDSFSVVVLNLPGAGSCGETEAEAIDNAREAIRAVMEVYREQGEEIPWRPVSESDTSEFVKLERITVDV